MKPGVRGKLFLVSFGIIAVVGAAGLAVLEPSLRGDLESNIEQELLRLARAVETILDTGAEPSLDKVDALADGLGRAVDARVTIIAPDGVVLGDSEVDLDLLHTLDNHGTRPEVIDALTHGQGSSRRFSTTVETEMLYVAIPFEWSQGTGAVRISRPLEAVDVAMGRLRAVMLVAAGIGVMLALLLSFLASHFLSRTLRQLVRATRRMAEGNGKQRIELAREDELGTLASSINRMSDEIEHLVETLARERNRFEAVLDGMGEAVIAVDEAQKITLENRSAREMLGHESEMVGRPLIDVLRVPGVEKVLEALRQGTATAVEFEITRGGRKIIEAHTQPMATVGRTVIVMRDVTRIRRLESIRRDFVANVSHELRTPVSLIRANAETLLDGALADPERSRKFVKAQLRASERLGQLIADLLDLSRIEAGKYPVELRAVNVGDAFRRAIAVFPERPDATPVDIAIEGDVDFCVMADEKAIDQILLNYVDNAIKYNQKGRQIRLSAAAHGGGVRLAVRDNGIGIAPEHRDRVFERFFRIDPGRSRARGGTGLGLAIVKHLAAAMGGDVGVDSASPKGAIFWLELPSSGETEAAR